MKKLEKCVIGILIILLIMQTACGNLKKGQDASGIEAGQSETADNIEQEGAVQNSRETTQLLHSDWLTSDGEVTRTWQKDYTSAEWEDSVGITIYIAFETSWGTEIEEELNHRLHVAGYDFYVHLETLDFEEFVNRSMSPVELREQRQQSGMTIDMYLTYDYQTEVKSGALLDLTDYLQSEGGSNLYAHFAPGIWRQLETEDERIYGIPANPVATTRYVYAYSPQLADVLGIDMTAFDGNMTIFEADFPAMIEQGIAPITLDCRQDFLMLSLFGMESYGEIFAVRHMEDDWEAVDLFEEEEVVSFYEQLGDWKENGFLYYTPSLLARLGAEAPLELNRNICDYGFLELVDVDRTSWSYDVNVAEDGYVETAFYVPREQAFVTGNRNSGIFVVNADTDCPQECMQFLNLLSTDDEIRNLLFNGIENYHYIWQDDIYIFENGSGHGFIIDSLGLIYDLSFWPAGHWGEKYETEIEELNQNVSEGISLTVECDFEGLEEQYEVCRQLMEENKLVFWGYYGTETRERIQALHDQMNEAGYQELIAAINSMRVQ